MSKKKTSFILGIDPGDRKSGYVVYDEEKHQVDVCGIEDNYSMLKLVEFHNFDEMAIEDIAHYGMPVGQTVFDTAKWAGRFAQKCYDISGAEPIFVKRQTVKSMICGSIKAKDANIRQALIDMFPKTGGGKNPVVGVNVKPGPLFGVKSHIWSALAIAITYSQIKNEP